MQQVIALRRRRQVLPKCVELIKNSVRYHREGRPDSSVLIVGIPNVGKSSLINILRNRHLHLKGTRAAPLAWLLLSLIS